MRIRLGRENSLWRLKFVCNKRNYVGQRGRVDSLKFGDINTDYFHHAASARMQRNKIKGLKDEHGVMQDGIAHLNPMISSYFRDRLVRK